MSVTYLEPFGVNTSANYTFANILVTANITNNGNVNFIGASNVSLGSNATVRITGGSSGAVLSTDGSGGLSWTSSGSVGVAGLNTQIQFNDNNSFGANANLTFNKTTKTLTVDNITANGAGLTYTTGGNVNGQVGNALIAGTVYTNAQPNITSVGSLNSLTVTGLITATGTGLKAANIQDSSGTITITTKYNSVSGDVGIYGNLNVGTSGTGFFIGDGGYISNVKSSNITGQVANALVAGTVYTNAQPNITSVGTLVNTTLGSANSLTGGNLVSANYLTGTLTTAAQPNITSVGSLSALTVSGDATVTGNFTVGGNTTYINVETFRVEDPIIELGGGVNGAPLTTNDSKDRGSLLHYYTTGVVDAFMGWDNSNAEFAFGSNVSVTSEVVTFNSFGNIRANYFIGNGSQLTGITATTGNANYANFAGNIVNAIQSNITSVGTLATVTHAANANVIMSGSLSQISGPNLVSANYVTTTANGNILMSGTLSQISGANLISGTYLTGTLTTAIQGNITSVGTLASLGVTGTTTSGNFATAGNITASFLVSNVATGTAPFTVTSTTRVANLNVAYANVSDYSAVSTASTGNYYINMVNGLTGNVQEYANASLIANATSGTFYSNNAALTNNLYTKYLTVSSISQESFSTITSATGIVVHNVSNGPTFYHTTPSANFTPNFTNVTVTANTTTIVSLIIVQGATPYMPTATANIQIEGANNTINWLFGIAPTGTASKIDIVNFSLVRTSSAWTVLGQSATFG